MDNYAEVVHQMQAFGVEFTERDLPLIIPTPRRKTCGRKGKWWYWLQLFHPRSGGCFVVGKFGCYKHHGSEAKVDVDWKKLSDEERARYRAERDAAEVRSREARALAIGQAAMSAAELWSHGTRRGSSPYLERKGVVGEACRYLRDGSVLVPLLRYDLPREERLRGLQRIYPGPRTHPRTGEELPQKTFTPGFGKTGCCLRLGQYSDATEVVLVCEGYATGLTLRAATDHQVPVYVALDAYNLAHVLPILRCLLPWPALLICADDDWKTADHEGPNPGRRKAMAVAKQVERCDIVWPVFKPATRQEKDTDFNDLHQREGLDTVSRQLERVIGALVSGVGRR